MAVHADHSGTHKEGIVWVPFGSVYVRCRRWWQYDGGVRKQAFVPIWAAPANLQATAAADGESVTVEWDPAVPPAENSLTGFNLYDFATIGVTETLTGSGKYDLRINYILAGGGGVVVYSRTSPGDDWLLEGYTTNIANFTLPDQWTGGQYLELLVIATVFPSGGGLPPYDLQGFSAHLIGNVGSGFTLQTSLPSSFRQKRIWRNTTNNFSSAAIVATIAGDSRVDTAPTPGNTYYYWVAERYDGILGPVAGPVSVTTPHATPAVIDYDWNQDLAGDAWCSFRQGNSNTQSMLIHYKSGLATNWTAHPNTPYVNTPDTILRACGHLSFSDKTTVYFRMIPCSGTNGTGTQGAAVEVVGTVDIQGGN